MDYLKFGNSKNFIVFLHGWGADKNSFLWLKDYYKDFSLIFLDFPGFGKSKSPKYTYFVSDYVDELKKLLDQFDIENLILVAHSFGGRVAIKFSFLFFNEYKSLRLCLVDSAGIKPRRSLKYYFKIFNYKICKFLVQKKVIKNKYLEKFGSSDYKKLPNVMKQTFINVVNEDLSKYAKFLKSETIIVWGKLDNETKIYMAKKLNRLIKNSKLYVLDNAGHFSFLDKKQEFLIILDSFVRNT